MQLEKIISISGKPGLYKLVSQVKNGFIIEDITSRKKISIGNSSQVSLLDNIAMFTTEKEVPLFEVFENIAKITDYKETIAHKSPESDLKEFMGQALPKYDTGRVYISDIKKLAQWYNLLHKAGYITPESFVKTEVEAEGTTENTSAEDELLKKATTKKTTTVKGEKTVTPKVKENTKAAKSAPKTANKKQG